MDINKQKFLLKLGFFPATDDFWHAAELPAFVAQEFNWAFRMPLATQRFMPWREETLAAMSSVELKKQASKMLNRKY